MGTIVGWILVFAIICGCIFAWTYMLHRGPHANDESEKSCDGNCSACAINAIKRMECEKSENNEKSES